MAYSHLLPPDLAALSRIIDGQPPDMQELFQCALAMFSVVEPEVGEDVLAYLREMARDALRGGSG